MLEVDHQRRGLSIGAARGAVQPQGTPEQQDQGTRTKKVATQQLNQVVVPPKKKKGFFGRLVAPKLSLTDPITAKQGDAIVGGVRYILDRLNEIDQSFYLVYVVECTIKGIAHELLRLPGMTFPRPLRPNSRL